MFICHERISRRFALRSSRARKGRTLAGHAAASARRRLKRSTRPPAATVCARPVWAGWQLEHTSTARSSRAARARIGRGPRGAARHLMAGSVDNRCVRSRSCSRGCRRRAWSSISRLPIATSRWRPAISPAGARSCGHISRLTSAAGCWRASSRPAAVSASRARRPGRPRFSPARDSTTSSSPTRWSTRSASGSSRPRPGARGSRCASTTAVTSTSCGSSRGRPACGSACSSRSTSGWGGRASTAGATRSSLWSASVVAGEALEFRGLQGYEGHAVLEVGARRSARVSWRSPRGSSAPSRSVSRPPGTRASSSRAVEPEPSISPSRPVR